MPNVLIVDDEQHILTSLRRLLRAEPYELLLEPDPARVREILATHAVDVVLSDYKMGAVSGLDVLSAVAELQPHARRLIISGYGEEIPADPLEAVGLYCPPLRKPPDPEELKSLLRAAVEAHPDALPAP